MAKQPIPKTIQELCTPAAIYFLISIVTLFVIALNPFLLDFQRAVIDKSYGVLFACADDLGSALLRIASLKSTHAVFKIMASVAGVFLNNKKFVICIRTNFN